MFNIIEQLLNRIFYIIYSFYLFIFHKIDKIDLFTNAIKSTRYEIATLNNQITHNVTLELIWTIIPIFILLSIALPSMDLLYFIETASAQGHLGIGVQVIGHQWYWSYEFVEYRQEFVEFITHNTSKFIKQSFDSYQLAEEDVFLTGGLRLLEVDNPLILPANNKINFFITSADVLHAWSVPSLGIKVDAVPGRLSLISTVIQGVGTLYGQCSEICGIGHGFMPIKIIAV
jgi:heme/copper-type cytochrome/quinol oxidase subunit 2